MLLLDDLVRLVDGLTRQELERWVRAGWVLPVQVRNDFQFREIDVARVQLIHEIRYDMQLDDEAMPLVLSLLDQVYGLRQELRQLTAAIETQPEDIRRAIMDAVAAQGDGGKVA